MKCWAKNISECCDTQSKEHYISQGLFSGKMLYVEGVPFLGTGRKLISKASLTKKCLCRRHNSLLSPYDEESIKFAKALEYGYQLSLKRRNSKAKSFSIHRKELDAELFTKWILKTFIGMIDFFPNKPCMELDQIAEIVFSNSKAKDFVDYTISMNVGQDFEITEEVSVAPLVRDNCSCGLAVSIYGIEIHALFNLESKVTSRSPKIKFTEQKQGLSYIVELK